ncbi:ROK family protein [Microbacterium nymphoidis]|uniref:ROK family protein n=1 Tax=Microbacterium nymphoidis TaxID=2898586 RepID=UPI001E61FB03|nr:ROK family protein [Microbacterium nymphoidis]MCD2497751.1 ROK family protein [Microbacterium nymphoidis]
MDQASTTPGSDNLPRLLTILHREGARSRAQLTADTGLNRSTIASLVASLTESGLAVEHDPAQTRRVGRPSPVVSPSSEVVAIAVNPEVDAVRLAAVGLDRAVRARATVELDAPPSPRQVADVIAATIAAWREGALSHARLVGIGLAVPGLVSGTALVANAPHLGWVDEPLADIVAETTGLPARAGNDASLGALAEHRFGSGAGRDDVVYLNGGPSGIGGGIITGGRLLRGVSGFSGEFGHIVAPFTDPADRRTASGAFEDELRAPGAETNTLVRDEIGVPDPRAAAQERARRRRILAATIATAVSILDTGAVVLGGTLAPLLGEGKDAKELRDAIAEQCIRPNDPDFAVLPAALADDRLFIGAAELAFAGLLADEALLA